MGILNSASQSVVLKGYDCIKNNMVLSSNKISNDEYIGIVKGSSKNSYQVYINNKHPRKSTCTCAYVKGNNKICKHMVALFFSSSKEDLKDYKDWLNCSYGENDYDDEYDDDYDYYEDDYDSCDRRERNSYSSESNINSVLFYDELFDKFINSLSKEELKQILIKELKEKKDYTYKNYIKDKVEKDLLINKEIKSKIDVIDKRLSNLSNIYNYNSAKYDDLLLNSNEKKFIENNYSKYKDAIDAILLKTELTCYEEYRWIAEFYKEKLSKKEIELFVENLKDYFNYLKHYSITNTVPKSNVFIVICILKGIINGDIDEISTLLIENYRLDEFVDFLVKKYKNRLEEIYKVLERRLKIKEDVNEDVNLDAFSTIYFSILREASNIRVEDEDYKAKYEFCDQVFFEALCIEFLITKDPVCLESIENFDSVKCEKFINYLIDNSKDIEALKVIYKYLERNEELFILLMEEKEDNDDELIENIDLFKEKHHAELKRYFISSFYEIIEENKSREIYKYATKYIEGLLKLDDGDEIVNNLIKDLKNNNQYNKRKALFDEINKVINKITNLDRKLVKLI